MTPSLAMGLFQRLVQIGQKVLGVFDAHAQWMSPSVTPVRSRTSLGMLACVMVAGW